MREDEDRVSVADPRDTEVVQALVALVGEAHVHTDAAERLWAAEDASGAAGIGRRPTPPVLPVCVVSPGTTAEVAAVLRLLAQHGVAVVPRGAGTGVMGGARVVTPSVVVDLGRLNDVVLRLEDGVVEVGAGATLGDINARLAPTGHILGHDPWSVAIATAGGALATDGVGYMAGRWGSMKHQVAGVEAVLADGSVVRSRPFKPAFGPDLVDVFAASQGTFGIVTRLWLYLRPLGRSSRFGTYRFAGFDAAYQAILALWETGVRYDLLDMSDDVPEALDLSPGMEDTFGRTAVLHLGALGEPEDTEARMRVADRVIAAFGESLGEGPARRYWEERHRWAEVYAREIQTPRNSARRRETRRMSRLDYLNLTLWPSQVPTLRRFALTYVAGVPGCTVGETGIWCRPELFSVVVTADPTTPQETLDEVMEALARRSQDLGGTAEAIHGTGLRWRRLLEREARPAWPALRAVKRALDPDGRMNPGKFPDDPAHDTAAPVVD